MTNTNTPHWNGIPIEARRGTAVVADDPAFSHYWARPIVGSRIAVVEVNLDGANYGGGIDYLDDQDGEGWAKVTNGGHPNRGHASVSIEPGSFIEGAPDLTPAEIATVQRFGLDREDA